MYIRYILRVSALLALLVLLIAPVVGLTTNITTTVVDTPYLDIPTWMFVTSIGFLFLVLSNVRSAWNPQSAQSLWAIIAPFFIFPGAYFALNLHTIDTLPVIGAAGTIGVLIQENVYHPSWLALILGIIFIFSFVNVFYVLSRKPVQKPTRGELDVSQDGEY